MPSRKLSDLTPECQRKAGEFSLAMHDEGIQFIFTQTLRNIAEQTAYFAQGRESVEEVNRLRALAGLPSIGYTQNKIITKTMNSKHLTGNAFDIAVLVDGKITWDVKHYELPAKIAESVGLKAGIRFGDPCHFEVEGV